MPATSFSATTAVLLAGAALASPSLSASMVTIGTTADCDHVIAIGANPLQDAVLANASEIRIQAGDLGDAPVLIAARSVHIRGGYGSCADARAGVTPIGRTRMGVNSDDDSRPLTIISTTTPQVVTLENLVLEDTRPAGAILTAWGGGITAIGKIDLRLLNNELRRLWASEGGGAISMLNEVRLSLIGSELVMNSSLGDAGGIHCQGGGRIVIDPHSLLFSNVAVGSAAQPGKGGAILADNCEVTVLARAQPELMYPEVRGLVSNRAFGDGGAIHAVDSTIKLLGGHHCLPDMDCPNLPVLLRGNRAGAADNGSGDGGGIHATRTPVRLDHFVVHDNRGIRGGGIHLRGESGQHSPLWLGHDPHRQAGGPDGHDCWHARSCNRLTNNVAVNAGGALALAYVDLAMERTHVQGNAAFSASLIDTTAFSYLTLRSNLITGNGPLVKASRDAPAGNVDSSLIRVSGAPLHLSGNTFADNRVTSDLIKLQGPVGNPNLTGNVFFEPALTRLIDDSEAASYTMNGWCNVSNIELPTSSSVVSNDPGFIDPGNGDYRPRADSITHRLCAFPVSATAFDHQRHRRGRPLPLQPRRYDVGAFVYRAADQGRVTARDAITMPIDDNAYDGSIASMNCRTITIPTVPGSVVVDDVSVGMAIEHSAIGDLTAKLVSPTGTVLALLERPRGDSDNPPGDNGTAPPHGDDSNLDPDHAIHFHDDHVDSAEEMGFFLNTSRAVCRDDRLCEYMPSPDEALHAGNSVAIFRNLAGEPVAGDWRLCLGDSAPGDTGYLDSWYLSIDYDGATVDRLFADGFQCTSGSPGCP